MRDVTLQESGFVTLDGTGAGTVRMRPDEPHAQWLPSTASVRCSTNAKEATCNIYAGPAPVDQYFVDGTFSGSSGDSTQNIDGRIISRTQLPYVWAVWTGGDAGAQATLTLSGTKKVP